MNDSAETKRLIINAGSVDLIKGTVKISLAKEKERLKDLKRLLSGEDGKREFVIYRGCCLFNNCPDMRPAFSLLTDMKFVNHKF